MYNQIKRKTNRKISKDKYFKLFSLLTTNNFSKT